MPARAGLRRVAFGVHRRDDGAEGGPGGAEFHDAGDRNRLALDRRDDPPASGVGLIGVLPPESSAPQLDPIGAEVGEGVAGPLCTGFALPLRHRHQHVQHKPPGGAAGVDAVRDGEQRPLPADEVGLYQRAQVADAAGETVEFADEQGIRATRAQGVEGAGQRGSVERLRGEPGILFDAHKVEVERDAVGRELRALGVEGHAPVGLAFGGDPNVANNPRPRCIHARDVTQVATLATGCVHRNDHACEQRPL